MSDFAHERRLETDVPSVVQPDGAHVGRMAGTDHILPVRVYFEDTDAAGIVYHANYLKFLERGRTDMLRLAGIEQSKLMASPDLGFFGFAVRECHLDFIAPARLDDQLLVTTRIVRTGGAALDIDQTISRDGGDIVRARIRIACLGGSGRPKRIPADFRPRLEALTVAPRPEPEPEQ